MSDSLLWSKSRDPFPDHIDTASLQEVQADIGERYRVEKLIGTGGYASVWKATDLRTGEDLAVKQMRRGTSTSVGGFYSEMRLLFGLNHPNIVAIRNLSETPAGVGYLFLEYCQGGNLRAHLERRRRVGLGACQPAFVREIAEQAFAAVRFAHQSRVVHRDIKPENLLFSQAISMDAQTLQLKLVDFGLAKAVVRADLKKGSVPSKLAGSPPYMAPEQFAGDYAPASDYYAVGIVLYELLHGQLPFMGTIHELAQKHCYENPAIDSSIPADLKSLLERCLIKSPDARWEAMDLDCPGMRLFHLDS